MLNNINLHKNAYITILKKRNVNKNYFSRKLFNKLVDKIIQNNDDEVEISKDLFASERSYITFQNQFKGHNSFINNKDKIYLGILLLNNIKIEIKQYKDQINKQTYSNEEQESNEDIPIENMLLLRDYLQYVDEQKSKHNLKLTPYQEKVIEDYEKLLNDKYDSTIYYIVDDQVNLNNIFILNNKEFDDYKILSNPLIEESLFEKGNERSMFNQKYSGKLIKLKIKILKKTTTSTVKMATKYQFTCHNNICTDKKFSMLPDELNSSNDVKHACPGFVNENDQQKYTKIRRTGFDVPNYQNLHLYDFEVATINNDVVSSKFVKPVFVLYANKPNLKPGHYMVDVFIEDRKLHQGNDSNHNMVYLIAEKSIQPKVDKELIEIGSGEVIANELGLPNCKVLDILQSIRKVYLEYSEEVIDNQGTWLQISTLISGLARLLFKYRYIGVSVIANQSLSKTYPASRIGIMVDPSYFFSQNGNDISRAGFIGGVNNKKEINGKNISVFDAGLVTTTGLCVFDEAKKFYMDEEMNETLKSLFMSEINIAKIGGGRAVQNYTPILLSNFNEHDSKYKMKIRETYLKLKKNEQNKNNISSSNEENNKRLNNINFYLPLSHYLNEHKDQVLVDAMTQVRVVYEKQYHIDWKTGGRLEASNRIFFDVVVDNKEKTLLENGITTGDTDINPPNSEILPIFEFQDEIINKFSCKNREINLNVKTEQTNKLSKSITEWLFAKGKGNNVFHTYANGYSRIDSKINSVLFRVCMVVQLVEDINSTKLSKNIKAFLEIILTKNKRGLSVDEYNFKDNETEYDKVNFNINNITLQMLEADKFLEKEKLKREVQKEYQEEQKEIKTKDDVEIGFDVGGIK